MTAPDARYDLLLKGGHVIDPANRLDGRADVAVRNSMIAEIGGEIPSTVASQSVNVAGLYVTPGLDETS